MNDIFVQTLNLSLPEIGQIYWFDGRGWYSPLWHKLTAMGWTSKTSQGGFVTISDPLGFPFCTGISRISALAELARKLEQIPGLSEEL